MLPYQYRLTRDQDFTRVYRLGKFFSASNLTIKGCPNNLKFSRFGFVISTKIAKKANVRNLLKRRLRALVQDNIKSLPAGFDMVISARAGAPTLTYDMLREQLGYLFQRAGLIKECHPGAKR